MERIDWIAVAKEAAKKSDDRLHTIIFEDGTITTVSGGWQARKPVLLDIGGECTAEEIYKAIKNALYSDKGIGEEIKK